MGDFLSLRSSNARQSLPTRIVSFAGSISLLVSSAMEHQSSFPRFGAITGPSISAINQTTLESKPWLSNSARSGFEHGHLKITEVQMVSDSCQK